MTIGQRALKKWNFGIIYGMLAAVRILYAQKWNDMSIPTWKEWMEN